MSKSKGRKNNYEAMFLISQAAEPSLGKAVDHVKHLLERAEAEVIALAKWDERRLAFEIDKQKRGLYILAYFSADPVNIEGLERDTNLSELIMRCMVLRADHLTIDEMKAADGRTDLETEIKMRDDEPSESSSPAQAPSESETASTSG
jgi:small subunit ribosomal protein S6